MLLKKTISFLTIILFILFSNSKVIFSAEQDNKVAKAFDFFDQGNYEDAEPLFKELIDDKPELLMLYYYYGACRTENQNYSENDLIHLLNANPNEAPEKINYYLGIQYQALNNWEQALKYFNKFKLSTSSDTQTELKVAEKIQQCYNQENPYADFVVEKTEIMSTDTLIENPEPVFNTALNESEVTVIDSSEISQPVLDSFQVQTDSTQNFIPEETIVQVPAEIDLPTEQKIELPIGNLIEFIVNSDITYFNTEHFQTAEGKDFYEKGSEKQKELDFTLNEIENLRNEYLTASSTTEKNSIGEKILTFENESYRLKEEASQLLIQARNSENNFWKNVSIDEIEEFASKIQNSKQIVNEPEKQVNPNTDQDSVPYINPAFLFNETTETVQEEKPKTEELIYKIQIGAYSRGLPTYVDRLFKKLSLIRRIENYTDEKGIVVYTTGNLSNFEDALQMQKQVRQEGVEDAYVVPYFQGKRITLEQAKKIEGGL